MRNFLPKASVLAATAAAVILSFTSTSRASLAANATNATNATNAEDARAAPDTDQAVRARRWDVLGGFAVGTSDLKGTSLRMTGDLLYWAFPALGFGLHASAGDDPIGAGGERNALVVEPHLLARARLAGSTWLLATAGLGLGYVERPRNDSLCSTSVICSTEASDFEASASVAGGALIRFKDVSLMPLVRLETLAFKTTAVTVNLGFGGSL